MELPPDCQRAVEIFLAVDTQWRSMIAGARMIFVGLDYVGVRAALRFLGMRVTPDEFRDLQMMESAALQAFAERR